MSNPLLGEIEIELGGKKTLLRPTFEGLCEVESLAGCSIAMLSHKFLNAQAGLRDHAAVAYGGICGATDNKPDVTFRQVGTDMMVQGFTKFTLSLSRFIGSAMTGKSLTDILKEAAEKKSVGDPGLKE